MKRDQKAPVEPDIQTGIQWGVGCLVGGAALVGALILVLLVSIAVQPPAWLQIVLGVSLVGGAICLAWLFTSALRRSQEAVARPRPKAVGAGASEAVGEQGPPNE
jgi:threonine/homoserine/homoserine lactone efflux protein